MGCVRFPLPIKYSNSVHYDRTINHSVVCIYISNIALEKSSLQIREKIYFS